MLSDRSLERGSLPAVDEVDVGLVEDPKPEAEVGAEGEEIIIEDGESGDESSLWITIHDVAYLERSSVCQLNFHAEHGQDHYYTDDGN